MSNTQAAATESTGPAKTEIGPVLVGFDGTPGGYDALELARLLSSIRGVRCIVATGLEYGPVSVHRAISDAENAEAEPLFEEARKALGDVEVETRVVGTRSPARMLVECTEREGAGTLVVGSPHHRSRIGRAVLGSVAEHVLHNAPCDVVVAPRGYAERRHDRLRQVAAAFDGMPESWLALRRAEDLALQAGTTLEILVAEDPVVSSVEAQKEGKPPARQDVMSEALASVRPSLSAHGKKLEPGRRKVAPTIAASIAEACRSDADILVCGSRLPMERAFAGSVTKHLIADSPCPVLVIPHAG